jgi:hypothetical protein
MNGIDTHYCIDISFILRGTKRKLELAVEYVSEGEQVKKQKGRSV